MLPSQRWASTRSIARELHPRMGRCIRAEMRSRRSRHPGKACRPEPFRRRRDGRSRLPGRCRSQSRRARSRGSHLRTRRSSLRQMDAGLEGTLRAASGPVAPYPRRVHPCRAPSNPLARGARRGRRGGVSVGWVWRHRRRSADRVIATGPAQPALAPLGYAGSSRSVERRRHNPHEP
jgi:hypothetical protein